MTYTTQCCYTEITNENASSPTKYVFTESDGSTAIAADFYVQIVNKTGLALLRYGGDWFNVSEQYSAFLAVNEMSPPVYVKGSTNGGDSALYFSYTADSGVGVTYAEVFFIITLLS